jgi:uncharacterized protein DUF6339
MTYPTLSAKAAERLIEAQRVKPDVRVDQFLVYRDSVESFNELNALNVLRKVEELKATYPAEIKPKSRHASQFEAEASSVVHSLIGSAECCADPGFWIWLSVCYFLKITQWRYGENLKVANLGLGAPAENFIYRLWLRAELVHDENRNDPYDLSRRGSSVDFWRSHMFRPTYSNSRPFARALLRFQYPSATSDATFTVTLIRQLAKRLTQLRSNQIFSCLNEEEAHSLISNEARSIAHTV